MREFRVLPGEGIPPIALGMRRDESRRAMDSPFLAYEKTPGQPVDAYFDAAFQVYFDDQGVVEYIELSNSIDMVVLLFGRNVFATPAQELLAGLSRDIELSSDDGGYSYVARTLSLCFWRPVLPLSFDDRDGMFFETVGVGISGYFAAAA